jgi:hypothetical protein
VSSLGFVDSRDNIIGLRPVPDFGRSAAHIRWRPRRRPAKRLPTEFLLVAKSNGQQQFSIGDGTGSTVFGDFDLSGGTNIGDRVTLSTFAGADYLQLLNAGGLNFVAFRDCAPMDGRGPSPKWRGTVPAKYKIKSRTPSKCLFFPFQKRASSSCAPHWR